MKMHHIQWPQKLNAMIQLMKMVLLYERKMFRLIDLIVEKATFEEKLQFQSVPRGAPLPLDAPMDGKCKFWTKVAFYALID